MSLVSVFECVPSRVWSLTRIVACEGAMPRSEIQARMTPLSSDSAQFNNLVRETVRLGLLDEEDDIRLGKGIRPADVASETWFADFVERAVMLATQESGNANVRYALAWLLTCRPGIDLGWNDDQKSRMHEELNGQDYEVSNSNRFAMLAYWARFLGYGIGFEMNKKIIVPDPTEAIRRHLKAVFESAVELTSSAFFTRLAQSIPVLEYGAVRSEVEQSLKRKRADNQISPATSTALLQLEASGEIELVHKADADVHLLDLMFGDPRRISHVKMLKERGRRK